MASMAAIEVTDATFQTEVLDKSKEVPVVVDLWAEWCGPCKTLGPILEKVVDATNGKVVLAKIDVEANPALGQAFKVQSIPAVYAVKDGAVVDGFLGAYPEPAVQQFVDSLLPSETEEAVSELIADGDSDEALSLLGRIPETDRTRHIAAKARMGGEGEVTHDEYDQQLVALLPQVKTDDEARQRFVDLLELMGPDDPRTAEYRRRLTAQLY